MFVENNPLPNHKAREVYVQEVNLDSKGNMNIVDVRDQYDLNHDTMQDVYQYFQTTGAQINKVLHKKFYDRNEKVDLIIFEVPYTNLEE